MTNCASTNYQPLATRRGLTLIELLVVITALAVLSGFGLSGWRTFQSRRLIENETDSLVSWFRLVRAKAISGDKPESSCERLDGYAVEISGRTLNAYPVCNGSQQDAVESFLVTASYSFNPSGFDPYLFFSVLSGRASQPASLIISDDNRTVIINISVTGQIDKEVSVLALPTNSLTPSDSSPQTTATPTSAPLPTPSSGDYFATSDAYFVPESTSLNQGNYTLVEIRLNSGLVPVSAINLTINFDSDLVSVSNLTAGADFEEIVSANVNNETGEMNLMFLSMVSNDQLPSGDLNVATFLVTALNSGTANFDFTQDFEIVGYHESEDVKHLDLTYSACEITVL